MRLIFISATCSQNEYNMICRKRKFPCLDSSQKFFDMFLRGLDGMDSIKTECICIAPISRNNYPENYIAAHMETNGSIVYHYVPIVNFPILKSLVAKHAIWRKLKVIIKAALACGEEIRVICDPLVLEALLPTVAAGKKFHIPTVGFLTDMPEFAIECDSFGKLKGMLYKEYNKKIKENISRLEKYVFLTTAMSIVAGKKPYMVADCIVDTEMFEQVLPDEKPEKPRVLYAGKLHRQFGLDLLKDAAAMLKADCTIEIYGDGNYAQELIRASQDNPKLKIHGIVPLNEILKVEVNSTILVNPRTSKGEFTKHSFPSKTAEYMMTGVPVVMFRLPGIGGEYAEYLRYAGDETAECLSAAIDALLALSEEKRREIGAKAKEFIIQNKSNKTQATRVIKFIS